MAIVLEEGLCRTCPELQAMAKTRLPLVCWRCEILTRTQDINTPIKSRVVGVSGSELSPAPRHQREGVRENQGGVEMTADGGKESWCNRN